MSSPWNSSVAANKTPLPPGVPRTRRWLAGILLAAAPALGYWHGNIVHDKLTGSQAVLELEAKVSTGPRFQIFVNSLWSEPHSTAVSTTEWTTYRFQAPSRLTVLRIDPPGGSGAVMLLRAIRLRRADGIVQGQPLAILQSWPKVGLEAAPPDREGIVRIEIKQEGGYTMGGLELDVTKQTLPLPSWFRINSTGFLWALAAFAAVLLCAGANWRSWRAIASAGIILAGAKLTYLAAATLQDKSKTLPGVSDAVGYTAFYAYPKPGQLLSITLALLAGLVVTLAVGAMVFRRTAWKPRLGTRSDSRIPGWILPLLCFSLFACATLPPSAVLYNAALHNKQAADYDSQNMLYWEYAAGKGDLPFRDFWYPYSGKYDESAPLYPDLARDWVARLLLFGVLGLSVYLCLGKSWTACLSVWLLLILMDCANLFWRGAIWRYLLSASIILLAAAALQQRSRWIGAGLGLWIAYAISEELSQPIFALPALVILLVAVLWANRATLQVYRPVLTAAAATTLIGTIWYISLLAYRGQLRGWLAFLAELPSSGSYSGWPLDFRSWLEFPQTIPQLYLMLVVLLLCAGGLQAAASRFSSPALLAPLGLGLVSIMHLQKEVVRPGMSAQVLIIPALGLGLLVAQQLLAAARFRRVVLAGSYAGVFLLTVFFGHDPSARAHFLGQLDFVSKLRNDFAYTVGHHSQWKTARARYFSPSALEYNGMSGEAMRSALEQALSLKPEESVYVLGDRADVYLLLRKPAPFYITLYNQSPIEAQARTLKWLEAKQPAYVLWNPEEKQFDQVPNVVRVPLLFRHVASHYVPQRILGSFHLLRRRRQGEPADIGYWREQLGEILPLGFIPSLSDAESGASESGAVRNRYLLVEAENPVEGRIRTIPMKFAGESASVQFTERSNVLKYAVNLERLPWADLDPGLPLLGARQEAGLRFRVLTLAFAKERLY